jgi:hypothetical protein
MNPLNRNGDVPARSKRPYWKRAHHDWRAWVIMLVMLAAMMAFLFVRIVRRSTPVLLDHSAPAVPGK